MASTRASLGEHAFQAALSEGRAMSLREAIQYALVETAPDRVPDDGSQRVQAE